MDKIVLEVVDYTGKGSRQTLDSLSAAKDAAIKLSLDRNTIALIVQNNGSVYGCAMRGYIFEMKYAPNIGDKARLCWVVDYGTNGGERRFMPGEAVTVQRLASSSIVRVSHDKYPDEDFPVVPEELRPDW